MASTISAGTTTTTALVYSADTSGVLQLQTNGTTTAVTIDTSQNVGIGVTPSAGWGSNAKVVDFVGDGTVFAQTNASIISLGNNFYWNNTDFKYKTGTGGTPVFASKYTQFQGKHIWSNAPTGTAGSTITFNDAMTLDASNNLLVGTTSANGKLSVYGGAVSSATYMVDIRNGTYLGFSIRDDGFAFLPSTYNKTTSSAANMFIDTGGVLYRSTSSLKYKNNVQDAVHGLADLLALRSVTYQGKSDADEGKTFGGLIAEEVHAAGLTEFVQYAEDGSPDALAYGNMVSLCIKSIQEQQAMITTLQTQVTALKG